MVKEGLQEQQSPKEQKEAKKRRPKGDGSIQQLGPNRYKIQIEAGYDAKGNRLRKTFTGATKREVIDKKNQYLNEKKQGTLTRTSTCKMSEFITRWLSIKEGKTRKNTYRAYVFLCDKHITPALGMHRVQNLKTAHVNDFIAAKRKEGLAPSSIQKLKALLHGILDLALKEGLVARNVVDNCDTITGETKTSIRPLTDEEMEKLLEVSRGVFEADKGKGNRFYLIYHIILLALATGARKSELLALKWDSIDTVRNTILIKESVVEVKGGIDINVPKTRTSRRVVSVDEEVLSALEELRGLRDTESEYIFCTREGSPLMPSNVGRAFRGVLEDAGLKGVRFHDLRHTHATHLVSGGLNFKMISERMGHADTRTTLNLYTHSLPEQDREAAKLMGSKLIKKVPNECLTAQLTAENLSKTESNQEDEIGQ